ncbi:RidA family protein [Reichenbachiella ulvae]|uniref:RidA family protein n=1 Tax=Reichenbachiella ulvae TaxID=2980104 RepID=A0ABT3CV82_9BACT|nr:RidA family protein [Reichenbachiella ulvae]MCV9387596.1 RidA family protein [Reichenbachiella ulvae]
MNLKDRIEELGLELPPAPPPGGVYVPLVVTGNMLYVSGHGPVLPDASLIKGKVGSALDKDAAKAAARQVGLTMLSTLIKHLDPKYKIKRTIKVLGMVNSEMDFFDQPYVMNGFSELMAEVFGKENGLGARSAVGMILPGNIPVEVEAIFEIEE